LKQLKGFLGNRRDYGDKQRNEALMAEEKLLTPTDVAERLQLQERTVTRWLRTGYLRGFKLGKEWRISPEDLYSFIEQHANKPLDKTA